MNYECSHHARTVMTARAIPAEWLERALHGPARVQPDKGDPKLIHHLLAIPEHDGRVLRVVLNNRVASHQIVTL